MKRNKPTPSAPAVPPPRPPLPVPTADWRCAGELVSFATAPDRRGRIRRLDGFYRDAGRGTPILLFVHGMGSDFYRSALKKAFLEAAPALGFSVLSFNNTGAGSGTENEDFRRTLPDLDAALAFARRRGHRTAVWVGHSTGCQKITFWQERRAPSGRTALALLAPADDHAIVRAQLGRRFDARVDWARRQVAAGRPEAPVPGLYERFGARRFLSVADPRQVEAGLFRYDGPLTRFRRIACPVLAVFGAEEEFAPVPPAEMLAILARRTRSSHFDSWLIPEAGHGFHGCEPALALAVADWLARAIAPARKRKAPSGGTP
ncbi:MAG: DUF1749 domain-containing protein [Kiritimatiellae bacterium]|nr:DUF1749 domain-containing protein [Kiritimatiellia bacterium]